MQQHFNFASGPGQLPAALLDQAASDLVNWEGTGMSVLELPFCSAEYRSLAERTEQDLRGLLGIPENYHVLFLQGGAYAHMSLLAMNLLGEEQCADYIITGHWSERAAMEARRYGTVNIAAGNSATGYLDIPPVSAWQLDPGAAYCHITTNETAHGVQFHFTPETGEVPLIADMTSDFLSRPLPVQRYGLIYASTQKNAGIAGLTVLVIRNDLLREPCRPLPAVFNYARQARSNGRVNTPPVFGIYFAGLVFRWLQDRGGLAAVARAAARKSGLLYAAIDADPFYSCPVASAVRSHVNICFQLRNKDLEKEFLAAAREHGLYFLRGHDAVGGVRASVYNAMPDSGVAALVAFLQEFADRHRPSARTAKSGSTAGGF